jgi:hypothetical protein
MRIAALLNDAPPSVPDAPPGDRSEALAADMCCTARAGRNFVGTHGRSIDGSLSAFSTFTFAPARELLGGVVEDTINCRNEIEWGERVFRCGLAVVKAGVPKLPIREPDMNRTGSAACAAGTTLQLLATRHL